MTSRVTGESEPLNARGPTVNCMQFPYILTANRPDMFRTRTRVKVCCIASEQEASLAVRSGAAAIGLVSRMPSGPGPIPETRIREIARTVPPGVATFLLTCETTAEPIIAQQRFCGTNTIQLVDEVEPGVHQRLRDALPGIALIVLASAIGGMAVQGPVRQACLRPERSRLPAAGSARTACCGSIWFRRMRRCSIAITWLITR